MTYQSELYSYVEVNGVRIPKFDMSVILKYNQLNTEGNLPDIVETNMVRSRNELRKSALRHIKYTGDVDSSGIGNITPGSYRQSLLPRA